MAIQEVDCGIWVLGAILGLLDQSSPPMQFLAISAILGHYRPPLAIMGSLSEVIPSESILATLNQKTLNPNKKLLGIL